MKKVLNYVIASIVGLVLLPLVLTLVTAVLLQVVLKYIVMGISFILEKCFTGLASTIERFVKKLSDKV